MTIGVVCDEIDSQDTKIQTEPFLVVEPENQRNNKLTFLDKITPSGEINACISFLITSLSIYLVYISVFHKHFLAPLNESHSNDTAINNATELFAASTFSLLFIVICGIVCGFLAQKCRLPGLLGILIVGIGLRNAFDESLFVFPAWSVVLRRTAFVVILLRGGLSLDGKALKKLKGACMRLCFLPCTFEAVVVAIASKFLFGMDLVFGFTLGFVLAAVSPAVVVPTMVEARSNGYGVDVGIPSLVVAAASLDDVYAITMFSIMLSILFATGDNIWLTVIRAPVEVISGVLFGVLCGIILCYFPHKSLKNKNMIRFALLFTMSLAWLFGTIALKVDAIGAIAVLVMAFVAGSFWKEEGHLPMEDHLALLWNLFFEPCLFGLIGFELTFDMVSWSIVGWGLLVLALGLTVRATVSFLSVYSAGLNKKEQLFVAIAWLPKATVQAALAPLALDIARSRSDLPAVYTDNGIILFTVAVLSIITTAPIGAFAIRLCTPLLLKKSSQN